MNLVPDPALATFFKPYLSPLGAVTADLRFLESLSFHLSGTFCEGCWGVNPQICSH